MAPCVADVQASKCQIPTRVKKPSARWCVCKGRSTMRVRSNRTPTETRRREGVLRRRHVPTRPEPVERPADHLFAERRARESGGPDDRAMYTCSCGYVFEADVTTSVACPHCGAGQAW